MDKKEIEGVGHFAPPQTKLGKKAWQIKLDRIVDNLMHDRCWNA